MQQTTVFHKPEAGKLHYFSASKIPRFN